VLKHRYFYNKYFVHSHLTGTKYIQRLSRLQFLFFINELYYKSGDHYMLNIRYKWNRY
jgi:hypothetical protein